MKEYWIIATMKPNKKKGAITVKKSRRIVCGLMALSMMVTPVSVMAASKSGVYGGYGYTVSATAYDNYGSGYGKYNSTARSMALTVTYSYRDYSGVFRSKSANASGTTYVAASTERTGSVDIATKQTVSNLYITGVTFSVTAN